MSQATMFNRLLSETKRILHFASPLVIGHMATIGMGLTDVYMAGQVSPVDLAGVTLGNSINIFVSLMLVAILLANAPMLGFHLGANDNAAARMQFRQCQWLAILLGALASLMVLGGISLTNYLGAGADVIAVARGYLTPMAATACIYHVMYWLRTTLEATKVPSAVMWVNISGLILNFFLDYGFVNGKLGLPQLGGAGCGWATLIVVSCQAVAFYIWLKFNRKTRKLDLFSERAKPQLKAISEILKLGLPMAATTLFEFSFFAIIPLIVAKLGAEVLSGHIIAQQFDGLMFVVPLAVAQGITIIVSHRIGAGQHALARESCIAGIGLVSVLALIQVAVYLLFAPSIAAFFSSDSQVQAIAIELLMLAAIYRFSDSVAIGAMGALRGYKITKAPMVAQLIAFWLIGFPLSYSLAMTDFWGPAMGVSGFWIGALASLSLSAILLGTMLFQHLQQEQQQA